MVVSKPSPPQNGPISRLGEHRDLSRPTGNSRKVVTSVETRQDKTLAFINEDHLPDRKQVQRMSSEDSAVSSSSLSRKQAPPIPKKPLLLSPPIHRQASSSSEAADIVDQKRSPPTGWKTSATIPAGSNYPPPPRRIPAITQLPLTARQNPSPGPTQMGHDHMQSLVYLDRSLPWSRSRSASGGSRGLLDDDEDGAQDIPSLQPSRRN